MPTDVEIARTCRLAQRGGAPSPAKEPGRAGAKVRRCADPQTEYRSEASLDTLATPAAQDLRCRWLRLPELLPADGAPSRGAATRDAEGPGRPGGCEPRSTATGPGGQLKPRGSSSVPTAASRPRRDRVRVAERVDSRRSGEPESLLDGQKEPQSDVGRATSTCGEVLMLPIPFGWH